MTARAHILDDDPRLAELARSQGYAVSREQLGLLGIDEQHVAAHRHARRWRGAGPLVVILHRGPLTRVGQVWAAVLASGDLAVAGSWTALTWWGLEGWEREAVHVVVPRGSKPAISARDIGSPLSVHESRRHVAERDQTTYNGLPVHRAARAAIDAAAWSRSPRTAGGVLAAVVQQGITTPDQLATELELAGKVNHYQLLGRVIADIRGGSQALSEIDFVRFCRREGLPRPRQQVRRQDSRGRTRFLDVELERGDGSVLRVEIDGMGHMAAQRWYDDLLRAAELQAVDGESILRLPALACRVEPERVAALLRRLLA